MKLPPDLQHGAVAGGISAAIRRGLIEAANVGQTLARQREISAAIRRGLIEAAAASAHVAVVAVISAAIRRGLIEATFATMLSPEMAVISAAIRRGLIEAPAPRSRQPGERRFPRPFAAASLKPECAGDGIGHCRRFPRPFAAASLKRDMGRAYHGPEGGISAAIRRGLIEATLRESLRWRYG